MLTGRTRYRVGWRKRLIIQVEFWYLPHQLYAVYAKKPYHLGWADATAENMQAIERGDVFPDRPADSSWWDLPPRPSKYSETESQKDES